MSSFAALRRACSVSGSCSSHCVVSSLPAQNEVSQWQVRVAAACGRFFQ